MLASVALSEGPGLEKETCLFLSLFEGPSRDSQGLQSLQKAVNAAFLSVDISDCFATWVAILKQFSKQYPTVK